MYNKNQTRLEKAHSRYFEQLNTYSYCDPYVDDETEMVDKLCEEAEVEFLKELLFNENDCAEYIENGKRFLEVEWLEKACDHFKSAKIYDAIKKQCEQALSKKYFFEQGELLASRFNLLFKIENEFIKKEKFCRLECAHTTYLKMLDYFMDIPKYVEDCSYEDLSKEAELIFIKEFLLNENECVSYVENPVAPLKGEWVKEASIYFKNDKLKKYADNMSSLYGVNIEK